MNKERKYRWKSRGNVQGNKIWRKKKLILPIRISLPILYFKDIFDYILFYFIFVTIKSNMEK